MISSLRSIRIRDSMVVAEPGSQTPLRRAKLCVMPVEFRVLGPLEIRRNGSPVPLRASKPRTLLGLLLVHHGRVVSVDALIEGLWPKSPPKGAQHAIETHASRLRALLGDDLPLAARPPGYV